MAILLPELPKLREALRVVLEEFTRENSTP